MGSIRFPGIVSMLLVLHCCTFSAAATPAAETAKDWREDIAFMSEEMSRVHKNLHHSIKPEELAARFATLAGRVADLERHQIIVELARIAAAVGDGHTNLSLHRDPQVRFQALPLSFYLYADGLYVRAARPEHAALVGARVDAFGEVSTAEALDRVAAIVSRDNAMGVQSHAPIYLAMPEILHALNLSSSQESVRLKLWQNGVEREESLQPEGTARLYPSDTDISLAPISGWKDAAEGEGGRRPQWLQDPGDPHRLIPMPDRGAVYLQLNKVGDSDDRSLSGLADEVTTLVRASNPAVVVLDLRHNRGGGGHLRYPLVKALIRAEDHDTRLAVLAGRNTYSAAQFLLDDLDVYSDAVVFGEPSGSKPNAYGDSRKIILPNSGLTVRASIYWWQENQNHEQQWTAPDVAVDYSFDDYATGRDPVLEAALAYQPQPDIGRRLQTAAAAGGADAVIAAVADFRGDPANRYVDIERPLVMSGYHLFQAGRSGDALAVLKHATAELPDFAPAHSVLAHVLHASGDSTAAIPIAERALQLAPDDAEVRALLEVLRSNEGVERD